ncbi:MAG: hypothetical protein ACI81V_000503, partial [Lentimonas sp.]
MLQAYPIETEYEVEAKSDRLLRAFVEFEGAPASKGESRARACAIAAWNPGPVA